MTTTATFTDIVGRAEGFMWQSARVLEQRRFEALFGSGGVEAVRAALAAYRTGDGGFGYALEPDGRGPSSQPVHVYYALRVLDQVGACSGPLVTGACDYLASITFPDGGLPLVHPDIAGYPRAPWWSLGEEPRGSLLPTAGITGLLHKNAVDHPWVTRATDFCWAGIDALTATHPYEVLSMVPFLDHAPDRDHAERAAERLGRLVHEGGLVVVDPSRPGQPADGYGAGELKYPHDYAPTPTSLARRWFSEEEMERSLDVLVAAQEDDGGWPLDWGAWAPVTLLEWRPAVTIEALLTLRAYGRLG